MPETTHYLILGFSVFFLTLGIYGASLVWRFKTTRQQIATLYTLND